MVVTPQQKGASALIYEDGLECVQFTFLLSTSLAKYIFFLP